MQYLDYSYTRKDHAFHRDKMHYLVRFVPSGVTVLDLGSYTGELGALLQQKGVAYFGLDNDPDLVASCVKKGLSVKRCDIDTDKVPYSTRFDYIFALDVLEHLHNPTLALEKLKKVLSPHGKFIISLPNDFHFLNRIRFVLGKKIYPNPFSPYTHLHTFTLSQAREFLSVQGLRVVRVDVYPGSVPSFLSYLVRRFFSRLWPSVLGRGMIYVCEVKQ